MNCPQCGGGVPADAAFCPYCGAPQPKPEPVSGDRRAVFDEVRDSDAWKFREAVERLSQLPGLGLGLRMAPIAIVVFVIIFGVIFMTIAFGMGGPGGGPGVMFVLVPLIIIGFAVVAGIGHFRKVARFDSAETDARPAIITGKRTHVSGGGNNSSAKTQYFVSAEFEDGSRAEFELVKDGIYAMLSEGDAGVLFTRSEFILDFDRVTQVRK